ncbi:MAG: AraC family transcriptional regulator [Clostridiales bacterium]|nr:AraC family transcriptional regulator [Clostridiales bacterium]
MRPVDYPYLTSSVARLSGIPVRAYRDGNELCRCFPADLPRDPMEICREEIFAIGEHVGTYVTPWFHYYGILNAGNVRFVLGPTAQIMADEQKLREIAFRADVPPEEIPAFLEGIHAIRRVPVETLITILCLLNHLLNGGETLELSDLSIRGAEEAPFPLDDRRTSHSLGADEPIRETHNTLAAEEALMEIVSRGDSETLRNWLASAPPIRSGTIAVDQLRQMRNLFIVTATLTSRAAIRGGMREDDAFTLSDAYIQRAELLSSHESILNLQINMLLEFTEQVEALRRSRHVTRLSLDAANYVRHHLSEPVSVAKMADAFFLSRPYLSAKFRQETGQTLTDFILSEKTEEAKRLLRYSDKPQAAIASFLGFSSQGHFARVFKKYAGMPPGEYREKRR